MRCAIVAALALVSARAESQTGPADDLPRIRMTDPNRDLFKIALPRAEGDGAREATEIETRDLDVVGLFRILDPASFPPALLAEGLGFNSINWSQVGAQGVAKMRITGGTLEGRLYMVGRGDAAVITKTHKLDGGGARSAVHAWANDIVEFLTGNRGPFGSRIAYAQTGGAHEIAVVDMDGGRTAVVTRMNSDCMLPAFSPGGGEIAFTSFLRDNPDLWIVSAGGGRARRVSRKPGLNTGAAWAGGGIVLTLSFDGNSELYRIGTDGSLQSRLTSSPAIDVSPSISPDGQIAFVSNRQGSPQIFVMGSGGGARRVTFQGKYNQTPKWNPRPDKPLIAFAGRDERGAFDIFTVDARSGDVQRVTQGQGSNFDPSWSPDGRLLVYASSRGGLWVMNPETRHEVQITRAAASSPSWGPAPKK